MCKAAFSPVFLAVATWAGKARAQATTHASAESLLQFIADRIDSVGEHLRAKPNKLVAIKIVVNSLLSNGAAVASNQFWLDGNQWRRIEPHLPTDLRGKKRADARRVISAIFHVLRGGRRWRIVGERAQFTQPTATAPLDLV